MRDATMTAKRGGYESAAALCGTRETHTPILEEGTVTRAENDAVLEYACALEEESAELKSGGGYDFTTVSTLEAAYAATKTTTGLLAEMRAVHASQMREMTALVAAATAINAPAPTCIEGQAPYEPSINPSRAVPPSLRSQDNGSLQKQKGRPHLQRLHQKLGDACRRRLPRTGDKQREPEIRMDILLHVG